MTLREALKKYEGKQVKVGASHGTAYFFAGIVNQDAYERLRIVSDNSKAKITKDAKRLDQQMAEIINRKRKHITNGFYTKEMEENDEMLMKMKQDKFSSLVQFLGEWVDVIDREVVDAFYANPTIEPEPTRVLVVDGYETGYYWTCDEVGKPRRKEA